MNGSDIKSRERYLESTLRRIAWLALLLGAAGSEGFTLYAGRNNQHIFLTVLFVFWVFLPFALLGLFMFFSNRGVNAVSTSLYCLSVFVMLASLIVYGFDLRPAGAANAALFVIVPPLSCLLIGVVIAAVRLIRRRK
jgi:hypothetical protein